MLTYIKNINSDSIYGFWEITESFEELSQNFDSKELKNISNNHPKKRLEYLVTRHLLKALCLHSKIEYSGVYKDDFGKPHLRNSSHQISISHSYPYVVCMLNKTKTCGIDIEKPRTQINRIKHKFLSQKELISAKDDPIKLCLFWSAKEALYKLYGKKNLLFIENIQVEFGLENRINGKIILNNKSNQHELLYEKEGDHVIVHSL